MAQSQKQYPQSNQIREIQSGGRILNLKQKMKKFTNCITKNSLFVEFDFFKTEPKFLVNGQEQYTSKYGGFIGLLILTAAFLITYNVSWVDQLSSQIVGKKIKKYAQLDEYSLFTHLQYPLLFTLTSLQQEDIPKQFKIYAIYYTNNGLEYSNQLSKNCPQTVNYCLNREQYPEQFGNIYAGAQQTDPRANITIQIIWCNPNNTDCPPFYNFELNTTYLNLRPVKGKQLEPYRQQFSNVGSLYQYQKKFIDFFITRLNYESNDKFFGHLSNLLPWSTQSFHLNSEFQIQFVLDQAMQYEVHRTLSEQENLVIIMNYTSSNQYFYYKQEFVDVTQSFIFFLALLDPIIVIGVIICVRWYNNNSRDLSIADKLFYVEDIVNDQKYDFTSGPAVFFTCLLYRHPITKIVEILMQFCGYNYSDILPTKCLQTISMINQGSNLLRQESFFKLLQTLSLIDNTQPRKVQLIKNNEKQEDQTQKQYFPNDSIKREAFRRFCQDNQFYSGYRKNRYYDLLVNKKYSGQLKFIVHKVFQTYVKNVTNLKNKNKFLETVYDDQIPVDMVKDRKIQEQSREQDGTHIQLHKSALKNSQAHMI